MNKKTNTVSLNKNLIDGLEDFDHSLPVSLLRAREAVMREFTPLLRSHGLSAEQWRVIRALKLDGALELSELSRRSFLLAPSLSRIAQNLEKREIVIRKPVTSDQRRSELELTSKGRALFNEVAPQSSEKYSQIRHKFGNQKLESLYELLNELVESLD